MSILDRLRGHQGEGLPYFAQREILRAPQR